MAGDGFGYPPAPAILRCSLFTTRSCIFHGLPSASDALNVKLFESRNLRFELPYVNAPVNVCAMNPSR